MEELIALRSKLEARVYELEKDKRIITPEVQYWLDEADALQREMEGERDSTCFQWRWSIVKRHRLNKRVQRCMDSLVLYKFLTTVHNLPTPIPDIENFPSHFRYPHNFVFFQSTKKASDQLLEALQDDSSYIIGFYGKRGTGKTKLVKTVGEEAKYMRIVDKIVFATVSEKPTVSIQGEIADCLGLIFHENSESGRARRLYHKLKVEKRVLVILDDVREKLELEDIGIPCDDNQCKVLLITRYQQVCTSMECQKEIPLHPLSEEEAWLFFKMHSGMYDDESSSNLLNVAREVAFECKGLLLAIKDVGSSLKRKPIEEWYATLDNLRHSMARYQVFLSFRGKDTRYSFTGFLYHALCREGFKTFMDDDGLEGGDQISQSLIKAIEDSRLSIIVFSENYANSTWCLDELVKILECKKMKNQLVWPIFYKVEPSDVRYQNNSYGKAMAAHENRFGNDPDKMKKWRSALSDVTHLKGEHFETGYEHEFIQMIVEKANNIKSRLYIQSMD